MKQFIVLMAMIALGLFLYACVAGPEDSILAALKGAWRHEIAAGPYAAVSPNAAVSPYAAMSPNAASGAGVPASATWAAIIAPAAKYYPGRELA